MRRPLHRKPGRGCIAAVLALAAGAGAAGQGAHLHGLVRVEVTIDAQALTVRLDAPLDSLLGFEHRPRTAAQRQAADTLLKQMSDVASLLRPNPAAQCTAGKAAVESDVLRAAAGAADDTHADLVASVAFRCSSIDKLASIEIGLFDRFKRVQRIDVQIAGAEGQSKQRLVRPANVVRLKR